MSSWEEREPAVSVVVPTYNRAQTLGAAIESVLGQTYERFELLVVDDGSTDQTQSVVEGFEDPRIRYRRFEGNRGANVARNAGIRNANADLVAFVDSDDTWRPEKLARQVERMRETPDRVGVVYTGYWLERPSGREYGPDPGRKDLEGDIYEALLAGNGRFIPTSTALVRRTCFDRVGYFDEALPRQQEWELWLRIAREFEFALVDDPLVVRSMRHDGVSISADPEALVTALDHILQKHVGAFQARPELLAQHRWQVGETRLLNGDPWRGRAQLLTALSHNPRLTYFVGIVAAVLGPQVYEAAFDLYRKLA
ncbi:glycosyltransferase family 2 protein [Haloarcula onubensis]|uniref:Glycosyltransferase n=1 Tax=Haloarcula onubensis TaxID=2950539 RepID=A0ABU2FNP9_9EURY|nr:glycosyltransferase family 2 protein [Halomicroarcula sp. S3CR25-11]MDS0281796.1 glycosyltransferase [Halomicroarcula sp. S3CR25-11]